ncbi:hypothetical protein ABQE48_16485 [Mycolicibacterium thermoresistibile]
MTESNTTGRRFVAGIDPSPRMVYWARVHDDGEARGAVVTLGSPSAEQQNLAGAYDLSQSNADLVVSRILEKGVPEMVVMGKLILTDIARDPSGPRRAALWWAIVGRFREMGVPVGEMAPMTAQAFMGQETDTSRRGGGRPLPGANGYKALQRRVLSVFDMKENPDFRYSTVANAASGAILMGWDIPGLPVTYERLKSLRSRACDFPVPVPEDELAWKRLHRNADDEVTV